MFAIGHEEQEEEKAEEDGEIDSLAIFPYVILAANLIYFESFIILIGYVILSEGL